MRVRVESGVRSLFLSVSCLVEVQGVFGYLNFM